MGEANIAALRRSEQRNDFWSTRGVFSVAQLMASPLAKASFTKPLGKAVRIFQQIGAFVRLPIAPGKTRSMPKRIWLLAEGTAGDSRRQVAGRSVQALMARRQGLGVNVDDIFLPKPVPEIFAAGSTERRPLLAGWNQTKEFSIVLQNLRYARL